MEPYRPRPYVPKRPKPKPLNPPRSPLYYQMHELRSRMLAAGHDNDPMARGDWWVVLMRGEDRKLKNQAYRMRRTQILPYGIWHVQTRRAEDYPVGDTVLIVRYEGVAPWWSRASEMAWRTRYERVVESTYDDMRNAQRRALERQCEDLQPPVNVIRCVTKDQAALVPRR